jgi:hypothetical protein
VRAYHGYRASNRTLTPTKEVKLAVYRGDGSDSIRLRLLTDERTAFNVEMTAAEARDVAISILKTLDVLT